MKQLALVAILTALGTVGSVAVAPYLGVAVYYLFAVLRPQALWEWALPPDVRWSFYVAIATIGAAILHGPWIVARASGGKGDGGEGDGEGNGSQEGWRGAVGGLGRGHLAVLLFGAWVLLSYADARNTAVAWPWLFEYGKIFVMFAVAAFVIRSVAEVWVLFLLAGLGLGYIAYEVNLLYLTQGRLDIFHRGYGGLDNNGAALMLAMGVPICLFAWEGTARLWRWLFIALIPVLIHAVLMSYSRGAMLALVAVSPLFCLRSRFKGYLLIGGALLIAALPIIAGKEIKERFFSISSKERDASADSRFASWRAGFLMAKDNPILGVGIRNSALYAYQYGADIQGRTIHSQYLQIAADTGFVGLGLYLVALFAVYRCLARARRGLADEEEARGGREDEDVEEDPEARRLRAVASGVEGALVVFCVGGAFLSLEVFELPYLLMLLGAKLPLLVEARSPVPLEDPEQEEEEEGLEPEGRLPVVILADEPEPVPTPAFPEWEGGAPRRPARGDGQRRHPAPDRTADPRRREP